MFRFAPSPNGRLHLGHAFSALLTSALAQKAGGTALLRIEDIDTARCKPEFVAGMIEDLAWLGLRYPRPVLRQSQRFDAYAEAAQKLLDRRLLYPCACTRAEIAARATRADPDGAPLYPGTCRGKMASDHPADRPLQWRLDSGRALARAPDLAVRVWHPETGAETARKANPAVWGDAVLVRKDTPTSYHLAVVVDDAFQAVTHVTRGADLEQATDLHVLLQALLGLPAPLYFHHELILDAERAKLAKSAGSPSLADLRDEGWTPSDVFAALGLPPPPGHQPI